MKLFKFFLFIFGCVMMFGCKNDNSAKNNVPLRPIEELFVLHNQSEVTASQIDLWRKEAEKTIKESIQQKNPLLTNFLEPDMWHYVAILKGSDVIFGKDLNGGWIDFKDDNTYEYGSYDTKNGNGQYFFEAESMMLTLLDNDTRFKPQLFRLLNNQDEAVLQGEPTYMDNSMQAKISRSAVFPVKTEVKPIE